MLFGWFLVLFGIGVVVVFASGAYQTFEPQSVFQRVNSGK